MDYYAELELTPDATADEIKRQYKKLALQYHPDRHPGKEGEVVPRFQAIGTAHEVLLDPEQRRKYDLTRQRTPQQSSFPRQANTSRRQDPTFNTGTTFDPPPRRNDPRYTAQRPDPNRFSAPPPHPNGTSAGSAGANRYSNWPNQGPPPPPRAANTSSKADAQKRANVFNTWQNMRYANKSQTPYPHPPRPEASQQPPQPPPRRPEGQHRPEGPTRGRAESIPPASGAFGRPSSSGDRMPPAPGMRGKPGFRVPPPFPGFNPGAPSPNDPRTPGTAGIPPSTPGGMPPPQPPRSANANYPPPPFFKQGPPPSHMNGGLDPESARRGHQQQNSSSSEENDKYRHATPYTQHPGEKIYFDSDALRRSASTRDATRVAQQEAARKQQQEPSHKRAQSAGRSPDSNSPRSRPPSSYGQSDSDVESATSGFANMGMNGNTNGMRSPPYQKHQPQQPQPQSQFPQQQQPPQPNQQSKPPPQQQPQPQQQKDRTPTPDPMEVDEPATGLDDLGSMASNLPHSKQHQSAPNTTTTSPTGLNSMHDLASNLPKTAHSDSTNHSQQQNIPHRTISPSDPPLPPKPPNIPTHLTQSTWSLYLNAISQYMRAYASFNAAMVSHFSQSAVSFQHKLDGPSGGMADGWIGAVGEAGGLGNWESYEKALRDEEKWRMAWNIARERHCEVVERHGRCRGRVLGGELGGGVGAR